MLRMNALAFGLVGLMAVGALGASQATPSYYDVNQKVDRARAAFADDESQKADGWNTFFDAIDEELQAQGAAETAADRLEHLERLGRIRDALGGVYWAPAAAVQGSLTNWLEPRLALNRALVQLDSTIEAQGDDWSPKTAWATYVDDLDAAIGAYEAAETASQRLNASRKLRGALDSLRTNLRARPWAPAFALEQTLDTVLDGPNLSLAADLNILQPFLAQQVVKPEVINFKGQTSYVQPGAYTGWGLMESNQGIAFYNGQWSYSTTPVQGFQQQVASQPQGDLAANLYQFASTIYNTNHVTAVAVITPNGLIVDPQNAPSVTAGFAAAPQPGAGSAIGRGLASLVGFNRQRILNELREQAMPQIRQETAQGTAELAQIKASQEAAQQNAMLRRYLPGDNTLVVPEAPVPVAIRELNLYSRPWAAFVEGLVEWQGAPDQVGAAFPKPEEFAGAIGSGATVDVNLSSALTNMAAGGYELDRVKEVENVVVSIVPPDEGAPTMDDITIQENGSYDDLMKAIADVRAKSGNDPNAIALRVTKPAAPPIFDVDSAGNLVVMVRDVTLEVPAPENFNQRGILGFGQNPKALRFVFGEITLTVQVSATPDEGGRAVAVNGEVTSVTYGGGGTTVFGVGEAEDQTQELNLLARTGALGVFAGRIQGQKVDRTIRVDQLLPGLVLTDISAIDPTGWLRVVAARDPGEPTPVPTNDPGRLISPDAEPYNQVTGASAPATPAPSPVAAAR